MNSMEWWMCSAPEGILSWLGPTLSDRCLRLFCCGCCRLIWPLLPDESSRKAVLTSEQVADGLVDGSALKGPVAAVRGLRCAHAGGWLAAWAAAESAGINARVAAAWVPAWAADAAGEAAARFAVTADDTAPVEEIAKTAWRQQRQLQCTLLRDIFADPFQPPARLDPGCLLWRNGAVVQAAREIYNRGGSEELSRLARLLEQAGCEDDSVLAHCRASGGHVRGCWVLDLLLGKRGVPRNEQNVNSVSLGSRTASSKIRVPPGLRREPPASALVARA